MRQLGVIEKLGLHLNHSSYDAVLIFGADNIRYVTGASVPFLPALERGAVACLLIKGSEPVLLVPAWLRDTFRDQGMVRNVKAYGHARSVAGSVHELVTAVANRGDIADATIGVTKERVPASLFAELRKQLPDARFESCDSWLRTQRMVKTAAERRLLEDAAFKTDHAIAAAAHHVMLYAARPEKGLSEILRVHCLERELDMTGYESLAVGASGSHATQQWPEAPFFGVGRGKHLAENELVRMEIRTSLDGYWTDAARLLTMGKPTTAQHKSYNELCLVRDKVVDLLKPGVPCNSIAQEVIDFCRSRDIGLLSDLGIGHGVGVAPVEAPYIDGSDVTEIETGMVLVVAPTITGPEGELMRSHETVVIEPEGARIIGWYRDWNTPYVAAQSWQHGGG